MKRKYFLPVFAVLCALQGILFFSCDILRLSPFEVESWSPGGGYHASPEAFVITVRFSHEPDRPSAERAFSLTEDDLALQGKFSWDGWTLIFHPSAPLEKNRDYRISVQAEAHDTKGLSMDKKFEAVFTSRPEGARPKVTGIYPGDETFLTDLTDTRGEVRILFSDPVPVISCVNYISFNPSMNGSWYLDAAGTAACFIPAEPWIMGKRYRISIAADFCNTAGRTLEKDLTSYFIVGDDKIPPALIGAYGIDSDGFEKIHLLPEELTHGNIPRPFTENSGWEKNYRLKLAFSEHVDTSSLKSRLSAEPSVSLLMETEPGFASEVIFRLKENPAYGSRFIITLNSGVKDVWGNESEETFVFRIFTDGIYSKPPSLVGIRLPMVPGAASETEQKPRDYGIGDIFGDLPILPIEGNESAYPYDQGTASWVELYFDCSPGASVDIFSLMNNFRVDTTNNALSFSPRSIKVSGFTWPDPCPRWESYYRVEIQGQLTNSVYSGVVTFQISSGLLDNLGNRNDKVFKIPLVK